MIMKKLAKSILLLSGITFLMMSCTHEFPAPNDAGSGTDTGSGTGTGTGTGGTPSQTSSCSADTVYFASEIAPLIISNCATTGCHDAISRNHGVELTSYSTIRAYTSPFNAGNSELYKVCVKSGNEKMPPPPLTPLTQAQLSKIIVWINQGAKNNQCSGGCDSTVFTYSGAVSLTMNTYCKGCHNPASLGGGIDLSTYSAVKAQAAGRMMGTINHTAGYSAMPKGGNMLSDCQIRQITKWIQAGTPNN